MGITFDHFEVFSKSAQRQACRRLEVPGSSFSIVPSVPRTSSSRTSVTVSSPTLEGSFLYWPAAPDAANLLDQLLHRSKVKVYHGVAVRRAAHQDVHQTAVLYTRAVAREAAAQPDFAPLLAGYNSFDMLLALLAACSQCLGRYSCAAAVAYYSLVVSYRMRCYQDWRIEGLHLDFLVIYKPLTVRRLWYLTRCCACCRGSVL